MEYYMTLAACKLYKGEKECPYKRNDKRIVFWNYEKWACKADLKTTRADVREIEEDAKRFGIYDDINYIANINDLDNGFYSFFWEDTFIGAVSIQKKALKKASLNGLIYM